MAKHPRLPTPTPQRIRTARERAGLTQAEASHVVHLAHSVRWSEYERGGHAMSLAAWELFLIQTGQREPLSSGAV